LSTVLADGRGRFEWSASADTHLWEIFLVLIRHSSKYLVALIAKSTVVCSCCGRKTATKAGYTIGR
jgi:hypothetical protein